MGLRRIMAGTITAVGVTLAAMPAFAQQTAPATNQATPAPTPSPTPGSIGNPALENFNLNGTVTREATPPARTPTPTPTPSPTPSPAPTADAPAPSARRDAPSPAPTPAPTREAAPSTSATSVSSSPAAPPPEAALAPPTQTTTVAPDLMPPAPASTGGSMWPWLATLAVALAAAGAWWMRRQKGESEELAFAGHAPEVSAPEPAPSPRPVAAPAPRAAPPPPPSDGITSRVGSAPLGLDGGIVSRALQPKLAFELTPLKFETDGQQNVRLTFELTVINVGSAPARDIRVEARLFNAGPEQDRQIGMFFRAPGAMGAKLPPIGPRDRVPLRSRIGMTTADYQALDLGGRSLVVPMLAVNAVYRGTAGETQESASWLVGAVPTGGEAEKLKPFPLDRPIASTSLAARIHSMGLQNQA